MTILDVGDPFPTLSLHLREGDLSVPDAFEGDYGVVLFLRGAWCPYCNGQLRAFQRAFDSLHADGIRVAAMWIDDESTTTAAAAKLKLGFPLGHGADAAAVSEATGAFVASEGFLQSTGFVLSPDGRVLVSVYSSGAIGRLLPEDVSGLVRYVREHAADH